jgi:hypothetical protein
MIKDDTFAESLDDYFPCVTSPLEIIASPNFAMLTMFPMRTLNVKAICYKRYILMKFRKFTEGASKCPLFRRSINNPSWFMSKASPAAAIK